MAGSARVLGKGPFLLRVGRWTGAGAGFPLPASGTRLPSSSLLPAWQAMGHLWRDNGSTEILDSETLSRPLEFTKHVSFPFPGDQMYLPILSRKLRPYEVEKLPKALQLASKQFSSLTCLFFTFPSLHYTIWDPRPDPHLSGHTHQEPPQAGCARRPDSPAEPQGRRPPSHPAGPG